MKRFFICALVCAMMCSCGQEKFCISGSISDADGEWLVLEKTALLGNIRLDSVRLKTNGKFSFQAPRPEYPDIYQLLLDGKRLVFVIDSTEHITLNTTLDSLSFADVEGSEKTQQITALRRSLITSTADEHRKLQREVIMADPRSMVAYFALHQTKGGIYMLNPNVPEDLVCFRAVATAFNTFMPQYYRSSALYGQVLEFINTKKAIANNEYMKQLIAESESTFLDIELPDENGTEQPLSQYKGKVTVLDFSAIGMQRSSAYIFDMRELWNKYHVRGLEIYQVSADADKALWQQTAENLPWTTVRGEQGAAERCFLTYNVANLPTLFLFNKKGEVIGRYYSFDAIKKDIEKEL